CCIESGRWDSNPRRPAWELAKTKAKNTIKPLILLRIIHFMLCCKRAQASALICQQKQYF
ncbi:MAG: hypothetical protein ACP5QA_14785, partial [Phycisphaerae bacterium]